MVVNVNNKYNVTKCCNRYRYLYNDLYQLTQREKKMLKIIDDTTNAQNVTTFYFNDRTTLKAVQDTSVARTPFIAQCRVTSEQQSLVKQYSNCVLIASY